jgi:replicative DNA helicase
MASAEMQLVCKVIKSGDLKKVVEWGITEDDFLNLETKSIYKQLISIYTNPDTSGSVLGPMLAAEKFGQLNVEAVDTHTTIDHLCIEVRNRRLSKELKETAQKVIEEADVSPLTALSTMQLGASAVMRLDAGKQTDVEIHTGLEQVLEEYEGVQSGKIVGKFTWPWSPLQEETGGGQEDDYVVLYGRPKSMKSWVLCYLIWWMIFNDFRVLVYTKEMTTKNIYKRIAAFLACVPYDDLRKGRLNHAQKQELMRWVGIAKSWAGQNRLIVLSAKDVAGRDTVAWLRSKVDKYTPQIVFVDGLYLMSPDNPKLTKTNERVENISRAMRAMILDTKIPVIATVQANRLAAKHDKAEFDEIAFSDTLSQDCTMAIRVIKNLDEPTISLVFAGAREIQFAGMKIKGIPCTCFAFDSLLTSKEIEKAKKADEPEDQSKNKRDPKTTNGKNGKPSAVDKAFNKNMDKVMAEI